MGGGLVRWAERIIGPVRLVQELPRRGVALCELVDEFGHRWFAKLAATDRDWSREVRAYRAVAEHLRGDIPVLRAADRGSGRLLLSALPGEHPDRLDPRAHREAGRLLRRLHAATNGRPAAHLAARSADRLEGLVSRAPHLFSGEEVAFAREQVAALGELPAMPEVLCHGDYKPHNWVVAPDGRLRVIDFGGSRLHLPAYDITRLHLGPWWGRPALAAAFFEGYGRRLDSDEEEFVRRYAPLSAICDIVFARNHQQPGRERIVRERLQAMMAARARERRPVGMAVRRTLRVIGRSAAL